MAVGPTERRLFQGFARLLDYPQPGLVEAARECEALVSQLVPPSISADEGGGDAAVLLRAFRTFAETTPLERLEEVYSSTFDLDPACHPYVGYHLLGESYKRSVFLLELKARYRARGFDVPGNELADHLAVMLRFLAVNEDRGLAGEIIQEALRPALDRMTGRARSEGYEEKEASRLQDSRTPEPPYRRVLEALRLVLQGFSVNETTVGDQRSAVA